MRTAQLKQLKWNEKRLLFPLRGDVRVIELGEKDASTENDYIRDLKGLISSSQEMYPGIDRWFKEKVIPGLRSSERIAYVGYENNRPIASAVLKRGTKAKICHLKIDQTFQDLYLGQMFFIQMTAEILHQAEQIHFTLPESLWADRSGFFESFGFIGVTKALRQYRPGDPELVCRAPIGLVWSAALEKLPQLLKRFSVDGRTGDSSVLLSIKPKYAERILGGEKSIEVRKKFSKKWLGKKVVLYASRPICAVVGEATIASIVEGRPSEIWAHCAPGLGCSRLEYEEYTASCLRVSAIELCNVQRFQSAIPRAQMSDLVGRDLVPPQSYLELNCRKHGGWESAISLITMLDGSVGRQRAVEAMKSPEMVPARHDG
jgi:predicted transcriptional regulator